MIELDFDRFTTKAGGREVHLTPKEWEILSLLARADGKIVTREGIAAGVWGGKSDYRPCDSRAVDQHIARLRRALGKNSGSIKTVTGKGYKAVNVAIVNAAPLTVGQVAEVKRTGKRTHIVLTVNGTPRHLTPGAKVML